MMWSSLQQCKSRG